MTYPPSTQECKDRARIEHDIEDADIDLIRDGINAIIEEKVGRPVAAASRTWVIEDPRSHPLEIVQAFLIPTYPVKHADTDLVTIVDADNVSVTDFRVNTETGLVVSLGSGFNNWPYTVTAKVGLDLMARYAERIEPKLTAAFFDLFLDFYQRRSPNAFAEGAGGGVITQYNQLGLPERVCQVLESIRRGMIH